MAEKPELVMDLFGDMEDLTIADIGAGTGYFAFRIAMRGADVIAIDIDPRAISWMDSEEKRYPEDVQARFRTRLATEDDPKLQEGEADIVLMVNTYIYLENRIRYFTNLQKGLSPGGRLVIIDFKQKETPIGPPVDERIALTQVQQELTAAGYTISSADDEALEYQYILTAVRPQ